MEDLSDPVTVSSVSASQATCSLREMDRLPSVSYTHLDVYKRQVEAHMPQHIPTVG